MPEALVWWQDLTTGERRCLARLPQPLLRPPRQSPSGRRILLNVNDGAAGAGQIWLMNYDGTGLRQVFALGPANDSRGTWLDEDRILVVTDRAGKDELGVFTLSTGTTQWLAGEPRLRPHAVVPGGKGGFACLCHTDATTEAVLFDASGARAFPNHSGRRFLVPHVGLPDGGWLAEAYDADAPPDLVRVFPDGQCRGLTPVPKPSVRRYRTPRDFRWHSTDGRPVQGWLHEPESPSRGLIAHVHPGPADHAEDRANPLTGFWVQLGYTVLAPNCRGSTGFGHDWRTAIVAEGWGGREQSDIRTGIEAALKRGFAPRKVAVAGTGFGGYASWHAITRFPGLVTAALPICGLSRLDLAFDTGAAPAVRNGLQAAMGRAPQDQPAGYVTASPAYFLDAIKGSVLIAHGLCDTQVSPDHSHEAIKLLSAAGVAHEAMLFFNEGHGILRRSNLEAYLLGSARFIDRAFAPEMG